LTASIIFTLLIIAVLVSVLYTNRIKASIVFLIATLIFVFSGILKVEDALAGMANKQIILIFLLIMLTNGVKQNIGSGFFFKIFGQNLSAGQFRFRMMVWVAGLSSLINNTPIVAFLVPYVKEWAEKKKLMASKFLIPLSFATILGGMITVVGTSTNLVLNGLIQQAGLKMLGFGDFFYLGILVTFVGLLYLVFFSDLLLPEHEERKQQVIEHLNEYIVETILRPQSSMVGKTIQEAGLRNLKEIFLVEIKRGFRTLSAVGPNEILQSGDCLFFAGNTKAIFSLMQEKTGLLLPEESHVQQNGFFKLAEAIVPSGSSIVGNSLRDCNFRNKYKGSVISIYRQGEKVAGNLGEIKIQAGDLLLMLTGNDWKLNIFSRDLIIVTRMGDIIDEKSKVGIWPSVLALSLLLVGITGLIDLFIAAAIGILIFFAFRILQFDQLRKSVDVELLTILVCSLAIGLAITKSGTASYIVEGPLGYFKHYSPMVLLTILFLFTVLLTSLITNAAAVSIMFPIALTMGEKTGGDMQPFFVAIAFAASACFITPIGYQTNLMVMGPGNYKFKDFLRIGIPLTVVYSLTCLFFIKYFYNIV